MGTHGLKIVRYRRRYYAYYNRLDSYLEGLGAEIVASIPTDHDEYRDWLEATRAHYAAKQHALDQRVHQLHAGTKPDYSSFGELFELPSELQQLDVSDIEYIYIINLDHEVFTINFSIHYRLGNIPRDDDLWMRATTRSINRFAPTISLELCPEEHIGSTAIELRRKDPNIDFDFDVVTPKTRIVDSPKMFLTLILANVMASYEETIIRFGREWEPDSFPFRELVFALVSIASGQASFHSLPAQQCDPRSCYFFNCNSNHMPKSSGWIDKPWVSADSAPWLQFGFMSHHNGQPPGTSPSGTMYWHQNVLVSLTLVVDGRAMSDAVTFGIQQRRTGFQVVVLSLFKVSFAEVFFHHGDDEPRIRVSEQLPLSPLRAVCCLSTHPRERPELKPGMKSYVSPTPSDRMRNEKNLTRKFPGLAALVHFFDAAAGRCEAYKSNDVHSMAPSSSAADASPVAEASKSPVPLPTELQDRILDFVDYDTWKTCQRVSPKFRRYCLGKFMLNNQTSLAAGPFFEVEEPSYKDSIAFDFKDAKTGEVSRMIRYSKTLMMSKYNWMPMVGGERKALMVDSLIQFRPVLPEKDE